MIEVLKFGGLFLLVVLVGIGCAMWIAHENKTNVALKRGRVQEEIAKTLFRQEHSEEYFWDTATPSARERYRRRAQEVFFAIRNHL